MGQWASIHRADWELEAASRNRAELGVFWRCPAASRGPSTPNPTQVSWKTLILKNWPIFTTPCGYVVNWPHVSQVRFWRPMCSHSEKGMPLGNPAYQGTKICGLLKKRPIFWFYLSWVKRWHFGSKKHGAFGCSQVPDTKTENNHNGP